MSRKSLRSIRFLMLAVALLAATAPNLLSPAGDSWADVGELPEPGGVITPGDKTDEIRMASESVVFAVKLDDGTFAGEDTRHYAHVTADFVMQSLSSKLVSKDLFFPFHSSLDQAGFQDPANSWGRQAKNVKVLVAGKEVEVSYTELTLPTQEKVIAAVFPVDFPAGEETAVQIQYDVRAIYEPKTPLLSFNYLMETGSHWAGSIGSGEVRFEFWKAIDSKADLGSVNDFFEVKNGNLVWDFSDLEPDSSHNIKVTFDPARLSTLETGTAPAGPQELTVRAFIDGRSRLVVQEDRAYWHHLDFAAPGRWLDPDTHQAHDEPTYLNGLDWYPVWPNEPDRENRDCGCDSSATSGIPPLASQDQTATLGIEQARGRVTIVQQPEAGNDYTLTVEFDDNDWGGADWYEVTLLYGVSGPPPNIPVAHGQAITTPLDIPVDITLTASHPEGEPLTFGLVTGPSHGVLTGSVPRLVYLPDTGYAGPDAFTFKVSDGQHDSDVAEISLLVGLPTEFPLDCSGPNLLRNGDFEAGFDGHGVGLDWGAFHTQGGAIDSFSDETWAPAVFEGTHSQLIVLSTTAAPPAADRFAGIYQTVTDLEPGAAYELSIAGLMREEAAHPGEDPYRYQVQWAYSSQGNQDWTQVAGWQDLPWDEISARTDPGTFSTYTARLVAPSQPLTLLIRAWKKWATPGRELDVNLDGIALRRCGLAPSVEPQPLCQSWDLAHDLRTYPDQENPNRDSYGNPGVWYFWERVSGQENAEVYEPLPSFTARAFGIQGLEQWTGRQVGSEQDVLPAVGINTTAQIQSSGTLAWPPHSVRVHPSDLPVVVGWQSPISGQVRISGLVRDMDAHCGNGVLWTIDLGTTPLASGNLGNEEAQAFADSQGGARLESVSMSEGESLYFMVDPNGEPGCDSTELNIRIESTACAASAPPTRATTEATAWQPQSPPVAPSERCCMGLVYDSARNVIVAVGGGNWTQLSNETWEYDGTNWTLRNDLPEQAPVRWTMAAAYNPDDQVTVLFGGRDETTFYNDTWQCDGRTWVRIDALTPPSPRNGAKMTYDRNRQRMVLFGGYYGPDNVFFDETWEYEDGQWTQRLPAHHPPARESSALVYDARRGVVVLFGGGQAAGSTVYGDTWEWNGDDWTQRLDLTTSPPARWAHAMAYDNDRQRTILFGGLTGTTTAFDDTWEYDGRTWTQVTSSPRPSARWDPGLAYDLLNKRMVLFAGMDWDGQFGWVDDTWHYGGQGVLLAGIQSKGTPGVEDVR